MDERRERGSKGEDLPFETRHLCIHERECLQMLKASDLRLGVRAAARRGAKPGSRKLHLRDVGGFFRLG